MWGFAALAPINFHYKAFYTENCPKCDFEFISLYVSIYSYLVTGVSQAISASLSRYKPSLVEVSAYMEGVCVLDRTGRTSCHLGITSMNKATLCLLPPITMGWRLSSLLSPREDGR